MPARLRNMTKAFALLAAALVTLALVTYTSTPVAAATINPDLPRTRSLCAYSSHSVSQLHDFEKLAGRPADCAMVFNDTAFNWSSWANPTMLNSTDNNHWWIGWKRADSARRLIISQPLVPSLGMPSDWLHRAAKGEYYWKAVALGKKLVGAGLGNSVIRVAHEANGYWYPWAVPATAAGQADWRGAWVQFVKAMRSVKGAHFTFDWCINYRTWGKGRGEITMDKFYPGDAYVDIVGLDAYDENTDQVSGRYWYQYNRPDGIRDVYNFAQAHDKPMSMPEWGMLPWGGGMKGGGDDPDYVAGIGQFIATHRIAYSSYWFADESVPLLEGSRGVDELNRWFGPSGKARSATACQSYCANLG